jgi:hypothetical protein
MAFTLITNARGFENPDGVSLVCSDGGNGGAAGQLNISAGQLVVATTGWEATDTTCDMEDTAGLAWVAGVRVKQQNVAAYAQAFYAIATQNITNYAPRLVHAVAAGWRGLIVSLYSATGPIIKDDELSESIDNIAVANTAGTLTVGGAAGLVVIGGKVYSGVTFTASPNFTMVYGADSYITQSYRLTPAPGEYIGSLTASAASMWAVAAMSFSQTGGGGAFNVNPTAPLAIASIVRVLGDISAKSKLWRVPTTAPQGTAVNVVVFDGSRNAYSVLAQGNATVDASGYASIPAATGSVGQTAFALVHNYADNPGTTSIFGGPGIASYTVI